MSKNSNDVPPEKSPLAPWGTNERTGQNPWPITPAEYSQSAKEWGAKIAAARKSAGLDRGRD